MTLFRMLRVLSPYTYFSLLCYTSSYLRLLRHHKTVKAGLHLAVNRVSSGVKCGPVIHSPADSCRRREKLRDDCFDKYGPPKKLDVAFTLKKTLAELW